MIVFLLLFRAVICNARFDNSQFGEKQAHIVSTGGDLESEHQASNPKFSASAILRYTPASYSEMGHWPGHLRWESELQ